MYVTIGVFIVSCFFLSKKSQLYFSAFLLLANILAAIIPMLSNAITGEGITDATIYHVLYGREKFSILFEYDSINYILIFFLVFRLFQVSLFLLPRLYSPFYTLLP